MSEALKAALEAVARMAPGSEVDSLEWRTFLEGLSPERKPASEAHKKISDGEE